MMNLLIWLGLTLAICPAAQGLYHELSQEVFKPPVALRNDSYFGYSITYDKKYKRLVISSPRSSNIGEVYDCDIESKNCIAINVTIDRVLSTNFTHDYWFGATVKSGPDFVVMCAPRVTKQRTHKHQSRYGTFGTCFQHSNGRVNAMNEINNQLRLEDAPEPFEATMDSFGWSIDVASDDSVIVGGPGMFAGRAMIYQRIQAVPKFIRYNSKISPTLNFGYGVSSGPFINKDLSYAVSSTYGKNGFGSVLFFKGVGMQRELNKGEDNKVVGSMFGAVLCAANLYDTGRSDLLVGAPTYALKSTYNLGAVYVYRGNTDTKTVAPAFKRKIVGATNGAMFGSAIVSLGDLNSDERDEVAIGAPFENGRGAVYIYSGADLASEKTEKTLSWLQKIEPEPNSAFGPSFGSSLTPLIDYDRNGCNELAIGAPFSDAVMLLKCISAIIVRTTVTFPNLQNRTLLGKTDFEFQVCLAVEEPRKFKEFKAPVETSVQMYHTHAHLKNDTMPFKYQTLLRTGQQEYCKQVPFVLPLDGNYDTQITYRVSSKLVENPLKIKKFEASRVILSDRSDIKLQDTLWVAECAGNKGCVPDLSLNASFSFKSDDHGYIIDSNKTEYFNISVSNSGEVAYDACVDVRIVGVPVFERPAVCERVTLSDGNRLLCKPTKPLRNNSTWRIDPIVLETTRLTNQDQNITVHINLRNRCTVAESKNFNFSAPLTSDPNSIVVKGITDIGEMVDTTVEEIDSYGKSLQHFYEIVNRGPTNWKGLTSIISLQKLPYIEYGEVPVTIHISTVLGDAYNDCPQTGNDTEYMHFTCKIETLIAKRQNVKIGVHIFIMPGKLDSDTFTKHNVTISSELTLGDDLGTLLLKSIKTTTTLRLKEAKVELWVILLATLVGLLILVIIAFILYKCGFLRRKKRQNLQELRKSIRRQTILRRSTISACQAAGEDRKQILERTHEDDEDVQTENASKDRASKDHASKDQEGKRCE